MGTGLTLQGTVHPELNHSGEMVRQVKLLGQCSGKAKRPVTNKSLLVDVDCLMFAPNCPFKTIQAIEQFGAVIEELLLKHGKKIIGE